MPRLDFWFDFGSSYSYPAVMTAEAEAAGRGVRLAWRPFLLGPIFAKQGLTTSPLKANPVKGAYSWRDLSRICAQLGLPFKGEPPGFPQSGVSAARVALVLEEAARPDFVRAVFRAQFGEGQTISDPSVVEAALKSLGHDADAVVAKAVSDGNKLALRRQTEDAERVGIFGAPSFITEDGELFWGHDRMADALDWAAR